MAGAATLNWFLNWLKKEEGDQGPGDRFGLVKNPLKNRIFKSLKIKVFRGKKIARQKQMF